MLNVIMLSVVILSVVMPSVVILGVVAPYLHFTLNFNGCQYLLWLLFTLGNIIVAATVINSKNDK
jgi:hypothetical protein